MFHKYFHHFFTTKYIECFAKDIKDIEKANNAIADRLKRIYKKQCDIVHGRYKSLLKASKLSIEYDKIQFEKFEKMLIETMSIISVMFILRFDMRENDTLLELAEYTEVIKFDKK